MSATTSLPLVLPLDDPAATLERVGGKGASLARMVAAGLPVPPGFHITTDAYRRFAAENGLQDDILAAVSAADADSPAALDAASERIAALFARGAVPDDVAEAIRRAYAALDRGDAPVAVRSSATAEDLPEMSFAGQQETYLNISGAARVLEAVRRCWASLWTARAIGYRARQGIAPRDVALAVVVQELVPADVAGILFTANPLTGARDQATINAAWGLGEAIVGGQVTPDTLVVEKASGRILDQRIAAKDVMTVRTPEGTREEPVPADLRARPALTPAQAAALARLGARIEDLYGRPMDIEWALSGDRIFVVQARPITALPAAPAAASRAPQADEWTLPDPKGHYMRSSVFELLPDPLSPLFATLALPAWSKALSTLLRSVGIQDRFPLMTLVTINGYGYYDLSLTPAQTARFLLVMPRVAVLFPRLMRTSRQRWQEARANYAALVNRWQHADPAGASAEDILLGTREIVEEAAAYYLTIQGGILPAAYMSEALFSLAYDRLLKGRDGPPALTFVLGFDSEPLRAEQSLYDLARWARGHPALAERLAGMTSEDFSSAYRGQAAGATTGTVSRGSLSASAGDVGASGGRPPRARREEWREEAAGEDGAWPAFWRRLSEYLDRFGHAIYDLDFAKPVLADDPAPVLETLKFFLGGDAPDPRERQAAAEAARKHAILTTLKRLRGPRRRLFRRLVNPAQRYAPLREDALADVGLGWPVLRRMLREIGRRLVARGALAAPDDVFWLTLDELREAAAALDARRPLARHQAAIAERRAAWERERATPPPVALPLKGGARFLGIDFSRVMPARTGQPAGDTLKGIAASPGRVTGPARVIHGPAEFDRMRRGDILVARITTPAWTPLFALAAGVVTDVGGPLSHSSIVAREYHIPAVLGTGEATERLSSGQRVTVDGDAGTVTLSP